VDEIAMVRLLGADGATEAALQRIRQLQKPLPPDFKFDRDEANSRE